MGPSAYKIIITAVRRHAVLIREETPARFGHAVFEQQQTVFLGGFVESDAGVQLGLHEVTRLAEAAAEGCRRGRWRLDVHDALVAAEPLLLLMV